MALIWKKGYIWPTFHIFLVTRESYKNSFSTYLTHIYTCILLTLLTFFCPTNFEKNMNLSGMVFSLVWVLVLILIRAILAQSKNNKMVSKI